MTRESKISASWKNDRFHPISHSNSYIRKKGFVTPERNLENKADTGEKKIYILSSYKMFPYFYFNCSSFSSKPRAMSEDG